MVKLKITGVIARQNTIVYISYEKNNNLSGKVLSFLNLLSVLILLINYAHAEIYNVTPDDLSNMPCGFENRHSLLPCIYKTEQTLPSTTYYLDLSHLSMDQVILPQKHMPFFLSIMMEKRKKRLFEYLKESVEDGVESEDFQVINQLEKSIELMVNPSWQIPFLVKFGDKISRIHYQQTGEQLPQCHVLEYCEQCKKAVTATPKSNSRYKFSADEIEIIKKRKVHFIELKERRLPFEPHPGVIREALNDLARGGLQPGNAPIFIGFVPSEYANPVATACSGFFDSDWSLYFIHGEDSHPIQITMLSHCCGLTAEGLSAIIKYDLWGKMLDVTPFYQDVVFTWSANLKIMGEILSFEGRAPELLHLRLLNGQFSQALKNILALADLNKDSQIIGSLAKAMNLKTLYRDEVHNMIINLQHLENYIACASLKRHQEIGKYFPEIVAQYGKMSFSFSKDIQHAQHLKAKEYFGAGFRLEGFTKDKITKGWGRQSIERIEQINQHDCFIVYPVAPRKPKCIVM